MALAILLLDVASLAKLASTFLILIFIGTNAAVIVLRESDAQWFRPSFRSPLYPALQVFGILSGAVMLGVLGWLALLAAAVSPPARFRAGRKTNT